MAANRVRRMLESPSKSSPPCKDYPHIQRAYQPPPRARERGSSPAGFWRKTGTHATIGGAIRRIRLISRGGCGTIGASGMALGQYTNRREMATGRHVHCESEIKLGTQRRAGGRRRGGAGGRAGLAVRGRALAQGRGCRDAGHDGDAVWIAVCVSGAVGAPGVYEPLSDARANDVPNPLYPRFRGNDGRDAGTTVKNRRRWRDNLAVIPHFFAPSS